jgi:hypothetical protein
MAVRRSRWSSLRPASAAGICSNSICSCRSAELSRSGGSATCCSVLGVAAGCAFGAGEVAASFCSWLTARCSAAVWRPTASCRSGSPAANQLRVGNQPTQPPPSLHPEPTPAPRATERVLHADLGSALTRLGTALTSWPAAQADRGVKRAFESRRSHSGLGRSPRRPFQLVEQAADLSRNDLSFASGRSRHLDRVRAQYTGF